MGVEGKVLGAAARRLFYGGFARGLDETEFANRRPLLQNVFERRAPTVASLLSVLVKSLPRRGAVLQARLGLRNWSGWECVKREGLGGKLECGFLAEDDLFSMVNYYWTFHFLCLSFKSHSRFIHLLTVLY